MSDWILRDREADATTSLLVYSTRQQVSSVFSTFWPCNVVKKE